MQGAAVYLLSRDGNSTRGAADIKPSGFKLQIAVDNEEADSEVELFDKTN